MTRLIFLIIIVTYFISCHNKSPTPPANKVILDSSIHETRLGESNYFIQLPKDFKISEARGVEVQLGYNIIPKDTSSSMFGLITIIRGDPVGGDISDNERSIIIIKSYLLAKEIEWKVIKTETGSFMALTSEKGDLNAFVASTKMPEIDSLISIVSTLKQK